MKPQVSRILLFAVLLLQSIAVRAESPPNILLILTDDHGWSQLSALMDPRVPESRSSYLETPNMNRILSEGMRFTSGYSPAPLCTPTRRSILCGTSTARSGTEFASSWVPADHMTIPKALRRANPDYRCAHFGKWGEKMISTPEQCGYHASDGMTGNATGGMPNTLGVKGGHDAGPPHFIDNEDPKRTRTMTDRAIASSVSKLPMESRSTCKRATMLSTFRSFARTKRSLSTRQRELLIVAILRHGRR